MSVQRPRPDLSSDTTPERPPIWINGRQRPAFNLRAYAAYSLMVTRAGLGPVLMRASGATTAFQRRIAAGAFPVATEKLGRAAQYLPTRSGIGATIGGVAGLISQAGQIVAPPPLVAESLAAYDALWRSRPMPSSGRLRGVDLDRVLSDPELDALRTAHPLRPRRADRQVAETGPHDRDAPFSTRQHPPEKVTDNAVPSVGTLAPASGQPLLVSAENAAPGQDTLLAIRDLINAAAPVDAPAVPKAGQPAPQTATAPPQQPPTARPRRPLPEWAKTGLRQLARAVAFALAWTLTVLALPYGLVKAAIAHLDGRDLLDLVEDR